jgi:small subunit ribosomal protein S1
VLGKILRISKQDVAIDIGFKSEGIIPIEEFRHPEQLNIGDEVDVFLDSVDDGMGTVQLSHRKAEFMKIWERVVDAYENDKVIQGICARRIKGGMVVDIIGIDAFLPGSQIDVKAIRDFDSYIGKEMDFKIVKLNHARKNVVVSHRVLIEKDLEKQRAKILEGLEKGQEREGQVKNITDFGVFIDLGGVDGLLHITDLSWGRVNHPSEVVKLDQKLTVKVLDYNEKKDRISLGLKQLTAHPWGKCGGEVSHRQGRRWSGRQYHRLRCICRTRQGRRGTHSYFRNVLVAACQTSFTNSLRWPGMSGEDSRYRLRRQKDLSRYQAVGAGSLGPP